MSYSAKHNDLRMIICRCSSGSDLPQWKSSDAKISLRASSGMREESVDKK